MAGNGELTQAEMDAVLGENLLVNTGADPVNMADIGAPIGRQTMAERMRVIVGVTNEWVTLATEVAPTLDEEPAFGQLDDENEDEENDEDEDPDLAEAATGDLAGIRAEAPLPEMAPTETTAYYWTQLAGAGLTYAVPHADVTAAQLVADGIDLIMARETVDHVPCSLIAADRLRQLGPANYTLRHPVGATTWDGVRFLRLRKDPPRPAAAPAAPATPAEAAAPVPTVPLIKPVFEVIRGRGFRDNCGHESGTFFAPVREILMPVVNRTIVVCVPHGDHTSCVPATETDNEFRIHIWGAPEMGHDLPSRNVRVMWGTPVPVPDCAYTEVCHYLNAIVTPEGDNVGCYDQHNMWIYHDACHSGAGHELTIWKKMLAVVADGLKYGVRGPTAEEVKASYIKLCSDRHAKRKADLEKTIIERKGQMEATRGHLLDYANKLFEAEVAMAGIKKLGPEDTTRYEKEYDSLLKIAKVKGVFVKGTMIQIITDLIYATDPRSGALYEIGAFRLEINTKTGGLFMFNTTRRVNGMRAKMHAPHVFPEGNPCMGNFQAIVTNLVAQREFSALVQMSIAYLESVNVSDGAGAFINRWPKMRDGVPETASQRRARIREETGRDVPEDEPEPATVAEQAAARATQPPAPPLYATRMAVGVPPITTAATFTTHYDALTGAVVTARNG